MTKELRGPPTQLDVDCSVTIPPKAAHFVGFLEAAIKSFKTLLRRSIALQSLTFEERSILLTTVDACLNSRPLIPMSKGPNDLEVFIRGPFLICASLHSLRIKRSTAAPKTQTTNLLKKSKLSQNIENSF